MNSNAQPIWEPGSEPTIAGKTYAQRIREPLWQPKTELKLNQTPESESISEPEPTIAGKTYPQRIREPLWQPKSETASNEGISLLAGMLGIAILIATAYFFYSASTVGAILGVLGILSVLSFMMIVATDGDAGVHWVFMLLTGLPPLTYLAALEGAPVLAGFFLMAWMGWILFIMWVLATGALGGLIKSINGKN